MNFTTRYKDKRLSYGSLIHELDGIQEDIAAGRDPVERLIRQVPQKFDPATHKRRRDPLVTVQDLQEKLDWREAPALKAALDKHPQEWDVAQRKGLVLFELMLHHQNELQDVARFWREEYNKIRSSIPPEFSDYMKLRTKIVSQQEK